METTDDTYCKIFLDSNIERTALIQLIGDMTGGKIDGYSVTAPTLVVDVMRNDDFDPVKSRTGEDAFLYFRYFIDIDRVDGRTNGDYIDSISGLLRGLWHMGIRAVASCDFEDLLPQPPSGVI